MISIRYPDPAFQSEVSEPFLDRMVKRMLLSLYKYGKVADAYPSKIDALATLRAGLDAYELDGNAERLVDVANYAMIEFMHPRHPRAHWHATDSDGSFGRVWQSGEHSQRSNTNAVENVRKPLYAREGD